MKTLFKLALISFLLASTWSVSYGQKARLKRATSPVDTAVVVTGIETNTIVMELDIDGMDAATSGFYELYVLVSSYTANATTGRITVKPRDFTRTGAGVKTYNTSLNDSTNITTSLALTANGLFNFHFEAPEAPLLSFDFVTVAGDTFSFQAWLRYLGE
jgi:hypothetical protein